MLSKRYELGETFVAPWKAVKSDRDFKILMSILQI